MKTRTTIFKLTLCLLLMAITFSPVAASMFVKMEFGDIVKSADIILSGKVVNIENRILEKDGIKVPYTFVTISVDDAIKGKLSGNIYMLKLAGGYIPEENITYHVGGMPEFKEGQEVFLFLRDNKTLYSPVVGFHQGRFNLIVDEKTGIKKVYDNFGKPVTESFITGDKTKDSALPVTYQVFRNIVIERSK